MIIRSDPQMFLVFEQHNKYQNLIQNAKEGVWVLM